MSQTLQKKLKALNKKISKVSAYTDISNEEQRAAYEKLPILTGIRDELVAVNEKLVQEEQENLSASFSTFFNLAARLQTIPSTHKFFSTLSSLLTDVLKFDKPELAISLASKSEKVYKDKIKFSELVEYIENCDAYIVEVPAVEEPVAENVQFGAVEAPIAEEAVVVPSVTIKHPINFFNPSEIEGKSTNRDTIGKWCLRLVLKIFHDLQRTLNWCQSLLFLCLDEV